jgi:23S rRNA (uracil1939-C5)-methyltransferase
MEWVLQTLRPARVVYVSCNPEALARDLCAAPPARYAIARVQPIDMFPHTAHVESVAVLDRLTASAASGSPAGSSRPARASSTRS